MRQGPPALRPSRWVGMCCPSRAGGWESGRWAAGGKRRTAEEGETYRVQPLVLQTTVTNQPEKLKNDKPLIPSILTEQQKINKTDTIFINRTHSTDVGL